MYCHSHIGSQCCQLRIWEFFYKIEILHFSVILIKLTFSSQDLALSKCWKVWYFLSFCKVLAFWNFSPKLPALTSWRCFALKPPTWLHFLNKIKKNKYFCATTNNLVHKHLRKLWENHKKFVDLILIWKWKLRNSVRPIPIYRPIISARLADNIGNKKLLIFAKKMRILKTANFAVQIRENILFQWKKKKLQYF